MAHKAILSVSGEDIPVLEFSVAFKQSRDDQGKPASGVKLGDFYLIMEGGTDLFFEWMIDKTRFESGTIKTYRDDQDSVMLTYEFENAFVTDVSESFYENVGNPNVSYKRVSSGEDLSDDVIDYQYRGFRLGRKDNTLLQNMWSRVRKFQERTNNPYCLFVTMSCEKLKIQDTQFENKWNGKLE
ncbi:type VI secretion system tube protein TssD [Spirosoma gilvum]